MSSEKWTADDIGDQSGRVAVVTGANAGLGLETAHELAGRGASVVLAVRDLNKGEQATESIRFDYPDAHLELQQLDLASLHSISNAASEINDRFERIDLLINNAGVMYTPKQKTADGFEMQFGTNHLGHFALTGQLLNRLLEVDRSRIVTVSSLAHRILSRIDFNDLQAEATLPPRASLRALKVGEPDVHLRASTPTRCRRSQDRSVGSPSRRIQHRTRPAHPGKPNR